MKSSLVTQLGKANEILSEKIEKKTMMLSWELKGT